MEKNEFITTCAKLLKNVKPNSVALAAEDAEKTFKELGFDSLDVMLLLLELDNVLGETMAELDMKVYNSPLKLYEYYVANAK